MSFTVLQYRNNDYIIWSQDNNTIVYLYVSLVSLFIMLYLHEVNYTKNL